jgi:hypothetical protein
MIYTIHVSQNYVSAKIKFTDREEAMAAYTKLKTAMNEYKLFSNDRQETIEIGGHKGTNPAIFKLHDLQHILFSEDSDEDMLAALVAAEKKAQDAFVEAGILLKRPPQEDQ